MSLFERFGDAGRALFGARDPARELASHMTPSASFGASNSLNDPDGWFLRSMGGGKTDAGVGVSEWNAVTLPVVYAAISIIADNMAQLPVNLLRVYPNGKREVQKDHPLQRIIHDEPNEDMTSFMVRQVTSHHALAWGNGYLEIERNRGGDPLALWPLYPDRTRPYKPPGSTLRYRTTINGKMMDLPPDDVIHIPAFGFDGYQGYSPVQVARDAIGMGLAMQKFGGKFFANDSKSGGFLMHPGKLGDTALKNIGDSFAQQGGNDNAFRVKVLEEGMKYIPTTIPPDDAQFLASRDFQVAEIARMFRVPLVLLQSMEKSTSWGSGIEQIIVGYVVFTLTPWVERWEQELNRKLLTAAERAAGFYFKFALNALLRGDMKARAEFYRTMFAIGALNPNEIRAYEELNPYDGGEKFWIPMNLADPADDPEPPEPPQSPTPPGLPGDDDEDETE